MKLPSPWELGEPKHFEAPKPKAAEKSVKKEEPLKSMLDDPHEERNVEIIEGDNPDSSEEVEVITVHLNESKNFCRRSAPKQRRS